MDYKITLSEITIQDNTMHLALKGQTRIPDKLTKVKLSLYFDNGIEDRRIPAVITEQKWDGESHTLTFFSEYDYLLDCLFWSSRNEKTDTVMYFNLMVGDDYQEKIALETTPEIFRQDNSHFICRPEEDQIRLMPGPEFGVPLPEDGLIKRGIERAGHIIRVIQRDEHFFKNRSFYVKKVTKKGNKTYIAESFAREKAKDTLVPNRVTFISVRQNEMSGNMAFVYDKIKDDKELDIRTYLNTTGMYDMTEAEMDEFAYLCASSKVIILDEFTAYIHFFDLRPETKVIQLWHACGAFKTFGYTRLGKPDGTLQTSANHRDYDYVTVSGESVRECYAEGFGIPLSHVAATGIPRTDIFFDENYRTAARERLYDKYPQIRGKKVILFAPTFRGTLRDTAYYPMEKFDVGSFMDAVGDEYILIIKHHPFVKEKQPVPERTAERVIDLTGREDVNELLFVTDLIITDYSSLVFEASLLDIPMLFYTFDLEQYISARDFYFNFETFVPGKFVAGQRELEEAVRTEDFEREKVRPFAEKYFDDFDGRSSERAAELIYKALRNG